MNRMVAVTAFMLIVTWCSAQQKLLSPAEFLGYELGERFTRHHRVVEYFEHVAEVMPNVSVTRYGETYEYRPLVYAVVTSPENASRIEEIRIDNLRRAGLMEGRPSSDKKAIVWLSYNVHGNEANSTEAAMQTLYDLADPTNAKTQEWLKNTVVIIDPCINPDGRDRYANFYNQYGNRPPNPSGDAKEHREPWPGGRSNHYYFDLNRDWAWVTQVESRERIKAYHRWMPHVHVDFHEQGFNNPYYFAPAAEPFHEVISPWQREFQTMIGKNNARYFDQKGWLYFTKEIFDLYYPSYGDTYPLYNGAIGMTYEQGGSGFGGLAITTEFDDELTLKDRLTHHYTAGLSTIEVTSLNATRVVDEFEKYFREAINTPGSAYKTYVLPAGNNPDNIARLARLLDVHGIRYGHPSSTRTVKGFDYGTRSQTTFTVSSSDLVISAYQPKSRFVTTLFEPESKLSDSLTYDITAWDLVYGYDLKGYATTERIDPAKPYAKSTVADNPQPSAKPYAYIFRYQSLDDVEFLTRLLQEGIAVRSSEQSFTSGGVRFEPGTLLVTRRNNEGVADFDQVVISTANEMSRKVFTTNTGLMEQGKDIGSGNVNFLKAPRVAMLFGEQTSSLSSGEIWYFFEQELHYPITQIGTDYFKNVDLDEYDVLIVPEGNYRIFDEALLKQVGQWVSGGGRLIVIGSGLRAFANKDGFGLKTYATDEEKKAAEKKEEAMRESEGLARYEDAERKSLSESISGAIYRVGLDRSHPLAFGLHDTYYTLKSNELRFAFLKSGWNVGVIKGNAKPIQGFAGYKANMKIANSLIFGVEDNGRGNIVYLVDNPLFRCFWENGKMLFSNAVFMVGQ